MEASITDQPPEPENSEPAIGEPSTAEYQDLNLEDETPEPTPPEPEPEPEPSTTATGHQLLTQEDLDDLNEGKN